MTTRNQKRKRLWLLVPMGLGCLMAVLAISSGGPAKVIVRLVGQKTDVDGKTHIAYEITNGTSSAVDLTVLEIEVSSERTGWWLASPEWRTAWHLEETAGAAQGNRHVTLNPLSAAQLEVLSPLHRDGTAMRGRLQSTKTAPVSGFLAVLRSLGYRLRLPARWLGGPSLVELPQVELPALMRPMPVQAKARPPATPAPAAAQPTEDLLPAGCIRLTGVNLRDALDLYAALADVKLEIDPGVRSLPTTLTLQNAEPLSRSAAVRLFEQALREQTGVVTSRLDSKRVAVKLKTEAKP